MFFIDEAGVRSDYHADTTWGPVAQTPTVTATGARFGLNTISAISAQGAPAVLGAPRHADRRGLHRLRPQFLHDAQRTGAEPVVCIVDNHPVHRAKAVDRFVNSTGGALRLHRLPATPRTSTPTSGCGRTSRTTAWHPQLPTASTR